MGPLRRLLIATVLALAMAAPAGSQAVAVAQSVQVQPPSAAIIDIRIGDHTDKTRFVLEMTDPRDFVLHAETSPRRLILDFADLTWARAPALPLPGAGLISDQHCLPADGGGVRCLLALAAPVRVRDVFYLPATSSVPFRFVLDLEEADDAAFEELVSHPVRAELQSDPVPATLSVPLPPHRPRPDRPLIAIDAGHGGADPGAIGVSGIFEKGVTLAVALRLRAVLEATGRYDVFLTREGDEYLRLRERVRLARMAGADLFISLHADSLEHDHVLRGASVYTLSDTASSQEAALLAARENRADALVDVALDPDDDMMASILIDLSQRLTRNESSMLAELMVTHLGEATLLMPHQTHRQAGFAVLKAPDVPSVLIEMGYLSNAEDEALLASDEHQAALAEAMARAIESYFSWLDGLQRS